jgi:transposase InsO family protein
MRLKYAVPLLCRLFDVSVAGYYASRRRPLSKRARENARLEVEIQAAHNRTRKTCGAERLQKDLEANGVKAGISRIRKLRRKLGIRCIQKRKFKATTDSNHSLPVADNLLGQKFSVSEPNKVWTSDITYVDTEEGWLYLAGHRDLFHNELVGYSMDARMTKGLVSASLLRALAAKRPPEGLIHHSDRGSQYCSHEYSKLLECNGITASMSRKGNCYDNAPMESFWGTLKNELIYHRKFKTREEAKREITEYIEVFYNRQRRQKRLGYLSPVVYEKMYYERLLAA